MISSLFPNIVFSVFMGKLTSNILKKVLRNVLNFESVSWLFNTEFQFLLLRWVINSLLVLLFMNLIYFLKLQ
jgi:hypothetical protein